MPPDIAAATSGSSLRATTRCPSGVLANTGTDAGPVSRSCTTVYPSIRAVPTAALVSTTWSAVESMDAYTPVMSGACQPFGGGAADHNPTECLVMYQPSPDTIPTPFGSARHRRAISTIEWLT